MEVVVTTGATRHVKLQSHCHKQHTDAVLFTGRMSFLLPNQQCQSTEGKTFCNQISVRNIYSNTAN